MICIPITGSTQRQALQQIDQAQKQAEILELRVDYQQDVDIEALPSFLMNVRERTNLPLIFTPRSPKEGGVWKLSDRERRAWYQIAFDFEIAYVDVEFAASSKLRNFVLQEKRNSRVIISWHNFQQTDSYPELLHRYHDMKAVHPDVVKIVTMAQQTADNLSLWFLLQQAQQDQQPMIGLCMGSVGQVSRALAISMGSLFTFASLNEGSTSAPGQMTMKELKEVIQQLNLKGF